MSKATPFTSLIFTPRELESYWARVDRRDGCWTWLGAMSRDGYGVFRFRQTSTGAHRAGYLIAHSAIPAGLVIDHLCRNRACVNPDHLEPVTSRTNSHRSPLLIKSQCHQGHELTPENTAHWGKSGKRYCITCHRERSRRSAQRRRQRDW